MNSERITAKDLITQLASKGHCSFTSEEARVALKVSPDACKLALNRLAKQGQIASPARGFYVIIPPEYRSLGCLPADQFIPTLMKHKGLKLLRGPADRRAILRRGPPASAGIPGLPGKKTADRFVAAKYELNSSPERRLTKYRCVRSTQSAVSFAFSTPEATALGPSRLPGTCRWAEPGRDQSCLNSPARSTRQH